MSSSAIWAPITSMRSRPLWPMLGPALLAVAYYTGAEAAFAIGTLTQQFAPFWPPNVALLCALLVAPRRHWLLYVAAAFPAHLLAERGVAMPLPQLLAAFGCNVSVALLNAVALSRLLRDQARLRSLRNASLYLLVAVVVNPAVVAFAAGFEPTLGDGDPQQYWQFWWRWYLSNALGNLTLTPVFLTWFPHAPRLSRQIPSWGRCIEASLLTLGLVVSCTVAFDIPLTRATQDLFPALLCLPVPLLLAATVRFGGKGASGAILIITVMVLFRAMHGVEPFAGGPPGQSALPVQLFLAVFAIPAILLAAVVEDLRNTNDRLSAVLDGISDCYYTLDRDGKITSLNAKGAAWWGASTPAELIGGNYWEITGERPQEQAWVQRTMQAGVAVRDQISSSGGRWIDVHGYPSASGFSIFYHDITERKAAELAAEATQALLQSSLDALNAQIAILDKTGTIIAANAAWRHVAEGVSQGGECYLIGANYLQESERAGPHRRIIADGLHKLIRGELDEFRCEYPSDFVEGAWFQLRGARLGNGADFRLVVANEDITEVKASESALRRLTGKLLRLQDEERRRIARELHDSTAQNLLGATLGIGQALRLAPRLKSTARAALEESRSLIEQSQREIRTVSYLLHPPMLDEAGLPAALRWFCEGFTKRTEIAVDLDIAPDIDRLPVEIEAALFRIAQEGLTNVHRHSGSASVRIALKLGVPSDAEPTVVLVIEDHGKGMPAEFAGSSGFGNRLHNLRNIGIGLTGMRERLHQFGGRLEIDSSPRGTTVCVTVPLAATRQAPLEILPLAASESARAEKA
jgi:signal transduction histidine kinase/integral membrane sensor domain MASE1